MSYFSEFPDIFYDLSKPGSNVANVVIVKDIMRRVKLNETLGDSVFAYDEYDIVDGERPDILAHQFYNSTRLAWVIMITNEIYDIYEDWPRTERELRNMIANKYGGEGPYVVKGTETSTGNTYSGKNGYYYPLFLSAKEARSYDRLQGFAGESHTHTFSEFPSTVFHMPTNTARGHGTNSFDDNTYRHYTINSGPNGIHHYERPQLSGDTTKKIRTSETTYLTYPSPGSVVTNNSDVVTNKQYEELENEKKRRIKILRANLIQEFVQEFRQLIKE